jgi:DNA-directed RNA polymerase specialized sigma24 family protein
MDSGRVRSNPSVVIVNQICAAIDAEYPIATGNREKLFRLILELAQKRARAEVLYRIDCAVDIDLSAIDDAAQNAVVRILEGMASYNPVMPFSHWCNTVISNTNNNTLWNEGRFNGRHKQVVRAYEDESQERGLDRLVARADGLRRTTGARRRGPGDPVIVSKESFRGSGPYAFDSSDTAHPTGGYSLDSEPIDPEEDRINELMPLLSADPFMSAYAELAMAGYTDKEAAEILDVTPKALEGKLRRFRAKCDRFEKNNYRESGGKHEVAVLHRMRTGKRKAPHTKRAAA